MAPDSKVLGEPSTKSRQSGQLLPVWCQTLLGAKYMFMYIYTYIRIVIGLTIFQPHFQKPDLPQVLV